MSTADILRQEGRQEGEILARQQAVVEALEIRFDRVPEGLREEIGRIADSPRLHVLFRAAIGCMDLESFAKESDSFASWRIPESIRDRVWWSVTAPDNRKPSGLLS